MKQGEYLVTAPALRLLPHQIDGINIPVHSHPSESHETTSHGAVSSAYISHH